MICALRHRLKTNQADTAIASLSYLVAVNPVMPVVVIEEDGVAADSIEEALFNTAVFRAFHEHCAAAVNGPVSARRCFVLFEEGAGCMRNSEARKANVRAEER